MRPATGGDAPQDRSERAWILHCEGFQVFGDSGQLLGIVVEVVYEPSARWDRPNALRIRSGAREIVAAIDDVYRVDPENRRIALMKRPSSPS